MRRSTTIVAALATSALLVLAGCGGSDEPTPEAGSSTPTTATSPASPDESSPASTEPTTEPAGGPTSIDDFPAVSGFTYQDLPGASLKAFAKAVKETPQVGKAAGKLIVKDGQQVGLILQIEIDPDTANLPGFEDDFLPGFASGFAGSSATPKIEDMNGVKVVKVDAPNAGGTAYAWIQGSIATALIFKTPADAEAFAQSALG